MIWQKALLYSLLIAVAGWSISACVPARKFEDMEQRKALYEDSTQLMKNSYEAAREELASLEEDYQQLTATNENLRKDTAKLWRQYRAVNEMNEDLNQLYEKVIEQNKALLENSNSEKEKYLAQLNEKEAQLNEKDQDLQRKQAELDQQQAALKEQQAILQEKQQRVQELEQMIARQDSAVSALKQKVQDAFLGFSSDELTVEQREGKIYVSMNNKLLFKSGRTDVDPKGVEALGKLADVMQKNPDINIMVEGHTDSIPVAAGSRMEDNWDLSVLRATSIVRILVDKGLTPTRLIPSGRSKYFPIASNATKEGRAMNRRTEIILSPKLDELMQVLQNP